MRIALKAELIGNMVVTTPVTAKHHPYSFEIYKENEKIWLKVTKPVKDYKEYLNKLFVKDEIVNIHIHKSHDRTSLNDSIFFYRIASQVIGGAHRLFALRLKGKYLHRAALAGNNESAVGIDNLTGHTA